MYEAIMINRITDNKFKLVSKYQPSGDQPQAIEQLVDNIEGGEKAQILMGATGTGKTYTSKAKQYSDCSYICWY